MESLINIGISVMVTAKFVDLIILIGQLANGIIN